MSNDSRSSGGKNDPAFEDASLWVSRILSMIAPGLLGLWLDDKFKTRYLALAGLVLGVTYAVVMFTQMSKSAFQKPVKRPPADPPPEERDAS
jgi:hypothetical protein